MNRWSLGLPLLALSLLGADGVPPDEVGFPADAAQFKSGPVLRGTIRHGEGLLPMDGATVSEVGSTGSVKTGPDGVFKLNLKNEETPAILVHRDGFVDAIQVVSAKSRLYFDGEFKIEVFSRADEDAAETEDFGTGWNPKAGRVVFNFQPLGYPGGVKAVLDAPGAEAWVYDNQDKASRGDTIPADPGPGEIVFRNVEPGTWPVSVTVPAGQTCSGPSQVPVVADTNTRVYFFCVKDGEEPQTATMGPPVWRKAAEEAGR